jgi:hemerythrin-like metal-binding protein
MDAFVWSDRFLTGESVVDDEHKELVRIINWVGHLQSQPERAAEFQEVLEQLLNYAVMHFRHEEELMATSGCDARHLDLHRAIHQDFAQQITAMREVTTGPTDTEFLLRFLTNWLAYHILGIDQSMARQVKAIRAGATATEAFEIERSIVTDPATASLLDALNSLYRVIASRNQALVDLNLRLENLVEERTKALSDANAQLVHEHAELKVALSTVENTQRQLLDSERRRALDAHRYMQQLLAQIVDGDPVPTLVIGADHKVTHWNKACEAITGVPASEMIGTRRQWAAFYPNERPILADLIIDSGGERMDALYGGKLKRCRIIEGAYEAEDFYPQFGNGGCWLYFTAAPLRDASGCIIGAIETLQDVTERHKAVDDLRSYQTHLEELVEKRTGEVGAANRQMAEDIAKREEAEAELRRRYMELTELNIQLSETQNQLVQSEKLASIGQLAAGVAHEINNPIGYVHSNIGALEKYLDDLFQVLAAYEAAEPALADPELRGKLKSLRQEVDLGFLLEDIPVLMRESKEGITRVKKIVQDLKDFSRVDSKQEWHWADLHQGIDSTINIVANEVKYKAEVVKEYGQLPDVECIASQLNQVFMNLLVNSAHAMGAERGRITIRTGTRDDQVWLEFSDNGSGIPEEIRGKIFDPFFTTKPVGKGTGLGLSLAYGIIQNHNGLIEVESEIGKGTTFRITLPVKHVEVVKGASQ